MDLTVTAQNILNGIAEFVAATSFGQFIIKKSSSVLLTIEKPAKYCVDGVAKTDNTALSWLVFWVVLVNLHIYRIGLSMILVKFGKNGIEVTDIVRHLQTWRRSLRSIRFRGLRKIRERSGNKNSNSVISSRGSSPPRTMTSRKRNHSEMLDYDLLEDLLNRTFSDDDTDSSFIISKIDEVSTDPSSNEDDYSNNHHQSPLKVKDQNNEPRSMQDTLPIESTSENENVDANASAKSTEITFESTVADTDELESTFMMTEEGSTSSLNDESRSIFESNGKLSIGSVTEPENTNGSVKCSKSAGNGSASLEPKSERVENVGHGEETNEQSDPTDALMAKFFQKGGKPNHRMYGKYPQGNKKNSKGHIDEKLSSIPKRNRSQKSSSQENLHVQQPKKGGNSQEFLHTEKGN